jgi:outer membrane protein assembly factor BamB
MKRLFVGLLLSGFILFSCSRSPNNPVDRNDPGSANVTVNVGSVGALAKQLDISFSRLTISLSAPGEITILDTFPISGNTQTTVSKTYNNLASLKTWTLTATSFDTKDSIIHSGTTTFNVLPRQTVTVPPLVLDSRYSMLKANFFPIRDSVTRCELLIDGSLKASVSFPKQSRLGDTVKLAFDYLYTNVLQRIKLDVYGDMWGFDTLLYTGDTAITPLPGINASYAVTLRWVGPHLPPPGQATMTVVLGEVGTIVINGSLGADWTMFHHDALHLGKSLANGPQDNNLLWEYQTGGEVNSSPAVDNQGHVFVGSEDGKLYAFNPDGSLRWSFATSGGVTSSPAIGQNGDIYVGSKDFTFYAIKQDGSLNWKYNTGSSITSSPTLDKDGNIYFGSWDRNLYVLDQNGTLIRQCALGGYVGLSPAIDKDRAVYIGSGAIMNALNPDCSIKWSAGHTNVVSSSVTLSQNQNVIYYGAEDGYFYARSAVDGSLIWRIYRYGGFQSTAAIGSDGTIYVGSNYGDLFALNPADGSDDWNGNGYMSLTVLAAPAIGADGTIYFASAYGGLFAKNPDCTTKWSITDFATYGHLNSSPAIGGNGFLYVGSTNGKVYAFGRN